MDKNSPEVGGGFLVALNWKVANNENDKDIAELDEQLHVQYSLALCAIRVSTRFARTLNAINRRTIQREQKQKTRPVLSLSLS